MLEKYQNLRSKAGANIKIKVHWSGAQVNKPLSKPIIPNQCNEFQINVAKTSARIWIFFLFFSLFISTKQA